MYNQHSPQRQLGMSSGLSRSLGSSSRRRKPERTTSLGSAVASFSRSDDSLDGALDLGASASRRKLAPLRPNSALGMSLSSAPLPGLPLPPRTPSPMSGVPSTEDKTAELSSSIHRLSSENEAHRRFHTRASEASSSLMTESKELKQQISQLEESLAKANKETAAAKAEADRRERVLEALLKQARAEKLEAQRKVGQFTSQVETMKKDMGRLEKAAAQHRGSSSTTPSSSTPASRAGAAAQAQAAALKMQVEAYKGELEVKDKQIVALRYELESRPPSTVGASAVLSDSLDDGDDDGGFEEVLREEMQAMKMAYEAKIAALQEQVDRQGLVKRQNEDATALPTPRKP